MKNLILPGGFSAREIGTVAPTLRQSEHAVGQRSVIRCIFRSMEFSFKLLLSGTGKTKVFMFLYNNNSYVQQMYV